MPRQQINARIPEELFIAAHDAPESMTELVEDGLRWRLNMPEGPVAELRERIERLERLAESQGAA